VRMCSNFRNSKLEREIILYESLPRIDCKTTLVDFKGGDELIKVSFPLKLDWKRVQRMYETPFAATLRPDGHFAGQTWVDCSDETHGVALLNRGTPGYWISDGRLELVLLRSLSNYTDYQTNGLRKGVPEYQQSTQTVLAREHGTHVFNYSLVPHTGNWQKVNLAQLGKSWNTPLVVTATPAGDLQKKVKSFIRFSPDFIMTALKQADSGRGLVVRGYESRGEKHRVTMTLPDQVREIFRASLLEEAQTAIPVAKTIEFDCAPHEIVTFLLVF
jgi:alpha-mannosidase